MSETEDVLSVAESEEASDTESSRPRSEADDDKDESEKQEESVTPRSERASTPKYNEPVKNLDCGDSQPPKLMSTCDRSKPGECNLLPLLVGRLRSALELSCSSQSSEDPLPLEDSGIDSEEDLRMWASDLCNSMNRSDQSPKPLDLKFLEDLLLSDIQSALSRLQETLKRVDINALTKYSSSLDPTNKLNLLRLISNLLTKLKIPDEVGKPDESHAVPVPAKRRRADRHTIGVSAKELACARKWLEEKNMNVNPVEPMSGVGAARKDPPVFSALGEVEGAFVKPVQPVQPTVDKQFDQVRDKYAKDVTQQSLYDQDREPGDKEDSRVPYDSTIESITTSSSGVDIDYKDDCPVTDEERHQVAPSYYHHHHHHQQQSTPSKYNKFMAKKSKIKRANTIDIPNYLKLQAESFGQSPNGCFALRRPINISDKTITNSANVIPSFQPKTESDRKFLALINKNSDSKPNVSGPPYKSFNYKQISTADKHWNSRFSNIKTTFDKPQLDPPNDVTVKHRGEPRRRSQSGTSDSGEPEGIVIGSLRLPYTPPKQKSMFTHAPTSPFQRIEKPSPNGESAPGFPKPSYLAKPGGTLQAKVKLFDQENTNSQVKPTAPAPPYRVKPYKVAEGAASAQSASVPRDEGLFEITNNKQQNYNPAYKEFVPRKSDVNLGGENNVYPQSVVNAATSKLIMHIDKSGGSKPKCSYPDVPSKTGHPKIQSNASYDDLQNRHRPRQHDNYNRVKTNNLANVAPCKVSEDQGNIDYANKSRGNWVRNEYEAAPTGIDTREKILSRQTSSSSSSYFGKPVAPPDSHTVRDNYSDKSNSLGPADATADFKSPMSKHRILSVNNVAQSPNVSSYSLTKPQNCPPSYKSSTEMLPVNSNDRFTNSVSQNYQTHNYQKLSESHPTKSQHDLGYGSNKERQSYSSSSNVYPKSYVDQNNHPRATDSTENYVAQRDVPLPNVRARPFNSGESFDQSYPKSHHASSRHSIQIYPPQAYRDKSPDQTFESPFDSPRSQPADEVSTFSVETVRPTMIKSYPEDPLLPEDENIQNQDISPKGVVTRYTCAIATIASDPECPGSSDPDGSQSRNHSLPHPKIPVYPTTQEERSDIPSIASYSTHLNMEQQTKPVIPFDEIQRHNLLQQQLIHKLQNEQRTNVQKRSYEIENRHESQIKPALVLPNKKINALKQAYEPNVIENKNTREKISIFEEKTSSSGKQHFKPLNIPKFDKGTRNFPIPKINVVNPSKVVQPKFHNKPSPTSRNIRLVDSSDEYLMSCANKPSRSIVLTKSESWHQLALSKSNLQVPQGLSSSQLKPPKPKSPSSLKLSKQYEASSSSENIKRMEEKIQRYFHSPTNTGGDGANDPLAIGKRESKSKRHFTSKKTHQTGLARSHTMPHLHDDKSIDETTDVEKAFDSLFLEATRADNPY